MVETVVKAQQLLINVKLLHAVETVSIAALHRRQARTRAHKVCKPTSQCGCTAWCEVASDIGACNRFCTAYNRTPCCISQPTDVPCLLRHTHLQSRHGGAHRKAAVRERHLHAVPLPPQAAQNAQAQRVFVAVSCTNGFDLASAEPRSRGSAVNALKKDNVVCKEGALAARLQLEAVLPQAVQRLPSALQARMARWLCMRCSIASAPCCLPASHAP